MVVYAILCDIRSCEMFRKFLLFVFVAMIASIHWCKEVGRIIREDTIVSISNMVDNFYHGYASAIQETRVTLTGVNQMVDNAHRAYENANQESRVTITEVNQTVDNARRAYESANQETRVTLTGVNQTVDNVNDTAGNLNEVLQNSKDASWFKLGLSTINSSAKENYHKMKNSVTQRKHT